MNYDHNKLPWVLHTRRKCDDYIEKCQPFDSNSIPSMASLFIKNLHKISKPFEARVFLTTYIYGHYCSFPDALISYKIISAENEEILARNEFDYTIDDIINDETYGADD